MKEPIQTPGNAAAQGLALLCRYNCGPVKFTGSNDALYERHLTFDHVVPVSAATPRDKFEAIAHSVRDVLSQRWLKTEQTYRERNAKRVYYLSLEFLMGLALTIGTRDGATIEMAEAAGEDIFFLFGLNAEQVTGSRGWYDPHWHYDHEPETRAALDLIAGDHFSRNEPGLFTPLLDTLLKYGDYYRHLADLKNYGEAHARLGELYLDKENLSRKAILNIAAAGEFSSDRTITEYAKEIWHNDPCPVETEDGNNA